MDNGDGSAEALNGEKGSEAAKFGERSPDIQQDQGASRDETSSAEEPHPSPSAPDSVGRRNGEMVEIPEQQNRFKSTRASLPLPSRSG